jgi:hypothetical protein
MQRHSTALHRVLVGGAVLLACAAALVVAQHTRAQTDRTAEVRQVVATYLSSLMSGDGKTACAQLTPSARGQLIEGGSAAGFGDSCQSVATTVKAYVDGLIAEAKSPAQAAEMRRMIERPTVEIESIGDDSAVARVSETVGHPVELSRTDSGWRISRMSLPLAD